MRAEAKTARLDATAARRTRADVAHGRDGKAPAKRPARVPKGARPPLRTPALDPCPGPRLHGEMVNQ